MHKRKRDLVILVALMLAAVVGLCACMAQEKPDETENVTPSTTEPGYGVDEWEDIDPTEVVGAVDDETTATQGQESSETTGPTQSTAGEQKPAVEDKPGSVSFEEYLKLSADEQQVYALSFPTMNDYIAWYNAEKEKHNNSQAIEITGPIDLGDLAGNNNG